MRITKVTPLNAQQPPESGFEIFPGDFSEVENDWYQSDIGSLKTLLDDDDLSFREFSLMRKAIGFESSLLVGLLIWGGREAFKVLAAWLPARAGRRVRIKFKDGSEIEAHSVRDLERIRDKFLADDDDQAN